MHRKRLAFLAAVLVACNDSSAPTPLRVSGAPEGGRQEESAPASPTLSIVGGPFYETSTLRAVPSAAGDWRYRWYVNGALVLGEAGDALTGLHFSRGDTVQAVGFRSAPGAATAAARPVDIRNSPPVVVAAAFAPGTRLPWDAFTVAAPEADDADGDALRFAAAWTVNGVPQAVTATVFRSRDLAPGDLVWADVYALDGEGPGAPFPLAPVAVEAYEKPPRIDAFDAAPRASAYGAPVLLTWTGEADRCALDPHVGPLEGEERFGGSRYVHPVTTTTYVLTCATATLAAAAAVTVTVAPQPPALWIAYGAAEIEYGDAVTLAWQAERTGGCTLDGAPVENAGAALRTPAAPEQAVLRCDGIAAAASVHVRRPVINEIAWMGTTADANDEWIELHHAGRRPLSLAGWTLASDDGAPALALTGTFAPGGYRLYERTNDDTVPGVAAAQIFTGFLSNTGERLVLRDALGRTVDAAGLPAGWPAGDAVLRATMERVSYAAAGTEPAAWATASAAYAAGYGTPATENSDAAHLTGGDTLAGLDVYLHDHRFAVFPGAGATAMHAALVAAVDSAEATLDFAFYGFEDAREVQDALARAVGRGVAVRGVVDAGRDGRLAMPGGAHVVAALPPGAVVTDGDDRLMHHKFAVVDGAAVWVGSANATSTDLRLGYNCNLAVYIRSAALAAAFAREFEDLFAGRAHRAKPPRRPLLIPRQADGTRLEAAFAPVDDPVHRVVVPAIAAAVGTIDAAIFTFTHAAVRDALVAAHERGVTVRVLADAAAAASPYSAHAFLREAGVPVKIETWPGKLHQKTLVIDGYRVVLGSLNWTVAGNDDNDESLVVIDNRALAAAVGAHFAADWAAVPDAWLAAVPRAEGADSPGSLDDFLDNDEDGRTDEGAPERLVRVDEAEGAVNLYFNKRVREAAANVANGAVDLQARLVARVNAATQAVDAAVYELNLPLLADALLDRAAAGVAVRLVADAKDVDPADAEAVARDLEMRALLERLRRGRDGAPGTADDVLLRADAPILAVTGATVRAAHGLPPAADDLLPFEAPVGLEFRTGRLVADGEPKPTGGGYYAAGDAMHHKFFVFDRRWVWTGSFNPTVTSQWGNTDAAVELHAPALAAVYEEEFAELWAGRFHGRKENPPRREVTVGGRVVEVVFSPRGAPMERLAQVAATADHSLYAAVFAWSDAGLAGVARAKAALPGFDFRAVFDGVFWDAWWSAAVPMSGRSLPGSGAPWVPPAAARYDGEDRKLHTKLLVVDAGTASDPVLVIGSTNFTASGDRINDENLLVIHDPALAAQAKQFFVGRWIQAGGRE